jgi:hypothetical protein
MREDALSGVFLSAAPISHDAAADEASAESAGLQANEA